MEIMIEIENDN